MDSKLIDQLMSLAVFLLVACCSQNLLCSPSAIAEELALGFEDFGRGIDYLHDDSAVAEFVRVAVLGRLLQTPRQAHVQPEFLLELSDSVRSNVQDGVWSFRLKNGIQFSSGGELHARDVLYSLQRCQSAGVLDAKLSFAARTVRAVPASSTTGIQREWVDVRCPDNFQEEKFRALSQRVARCPIMEAQSGSLFGPDVGLGTNLVSTGPFMLDYFKSGNSITLRRNPNYHGATPALDQIKLRSIPSANQGLSALRLGTVGALFTNDVLVMARARSDETLEVDSCLGFTVVYRRSLNMVCKPYARFVDLRYRS